MGMEFTVWVFKHVKILFSILQPEFPFVVCKSRQYELNLFIIFVKKQLKCFLLNSMLDVF